MIATFMIYSATIAVLISLAALAADRGFAILALPRRGVWAIALLGSLLLPVLAMLEGAPTLPSAQSRAVLEHVAAPTRAPAIAPAAQGAFDAMSSMRLQSPQIALPRLESTLTLLWASASAGMLLYFVMGILLTRRRMRDARRARIRGYSVLVSDDIGPAVFGFLRPSVVIPHWLLATPLPLQSLVLAHEREHVAARDQLLLLLALLVLIAAPWNLLLWWQARRLRFAIEVDCDARVLRSGADAIAYGEVLLQVGRHSLRAPMGAVALIEPPTDLERRIRIMTSARSRHITLSAAACLALCASLVTVAAQFDPPASRATKVGMPPMGATLPARVQAIVRDTYPELFAPTLTQPALVKIVLNNDLSIDWSEKKLLPAGTTQAAAEASEHPKAAVLDRLHPDEPRVAGTLLMQDTMESQPVFITFAVHVFHESRSPAAVESALREKFPELYDDASDGEVLLIALMNEDGSVGQARHRLRMANESLTGEENQRRALAEVTAGTLDIGVMSMIGSRSQAPFRPAVLYAFHKSGEQAIDADPMRPADRSELSASARAIVERYFPEIADGSSNPHELLWVLLDQIGDVIATGRGATSPDPLMVNLERHYPGAATSNRLTTQLTALFGREMRDTQGEPLLVTFAWLDGKESDRARSRSTAQSIQVDATIYRNGQLVSSNPMTLAVGRPHTHTSELLRLDVTALDVGRDMVDLGVVMRVPIDPKGIEFAERWEIVSQPMLRAKLGNDATIEQGVRYPGKEGDVIWRVVLTPRRAG